MRKIFISKIVLCGTILLTECNINHGYSMEKETQNHLKPTSLVLLETEELRDNILSSLNDKDKNSVFATCSLFIAASEEFYSNKYKGLQMMDFGVSPKLNYGVNIKFATFLALMHNLTDGDGCEIEHQRAETISQMIMGLEINKKTALIQEYTELLKTNLKLSPKVDKLTVFEKPLIEYIKKDYENKYTVMTMKLLTIMNEQKDNSPNFKFLYLAPSTLKCTTRRKSSEH